MRLDLELNSLSLKKKHNDLKWLNSLYLKDREWSNVMSLLEDKKKYTSK